MFRDHIPNINKDIQRTKRAIISIGCSFVQGHGAVVQEIYDRYSWETPYVDLTYKLSALTESERQKLLSDYPDIEFDPYNQVFEFRTHEYNNSFVNVLAKKYFNGDYAAINLGRSGNGNRASIKELYFYPDILWNEINECIVIYCPTGLERLDFISDEYHTPNDHGRWKTIFPHELQNDGNVQKELRSSYHRYLYSEKFEVLEQITHVQELILWCKYKNAKLIIVPAFSGSYERTKFAKQISRDIKRDNCSLQIKNKFPREIDVAAFRVADMWPWENMFYPDDCPTFVDLMMKQEFPSTWYPHFYQYFGRGTPKKWMTPCCHPSVKGHDLFAKYLYEELTSNPLQYNLNKRIGNL